MLQLQVIRQDPQWIKERLAVKNFSEIELVDQIIRLDDERKKLQLEFDTIQAKVNSSSKEIGQLMAKGNKDEAGVKKQEVSALKTSLQPINERLNEVEKLLQDELVRLPNLPS